MEVNSQLEKSCTGLALLFQQVINDMKNSTPVWEDFATKATKLHSTLRSTVVAATSFLEAFQRLADIATSTRGATKDIGSALTRLCMRHRNIESKLKVVTSALMDAMVMPLQDKMEDWKKIIIQLEKDRNRETKKCHQEIKKALGETQRLQRKLKKGKTDFQKPLEASMKDLQEKLSALKDNERNAVRAALIEERSRYCLLVQCIKPFMDGEISLLGDVTHLQEIMDSLSRQATDPLGLPEASEQLVVDICESPNSWPCQPIPAQPQSPSRSVSSSKSSLSSLSSSSSSSSFSPIHRRQGRTHSESFTDSLAADNSATPGYNQVTSSIYGHWPGSPPLRVGRPRETSDDRPHTISTAYERSHVRSAIYPNTFQPPTSSQVNSVPTTPNPHITAVSRLTRIRPHSLVRNVELAELFDKKEMPFRAESEVDVTTSAESSVRVHIQNVQHPFSCADNAGDVIQQSERKNMSCVTDVSGEGHVAVRRKQSVRMSESGNSRMGQASGTSNDRPYHPIHGKMEDAQMNGVDQMAKPSRSIQHSVSCSVIGNEPNAVAVDDIYAKVNGNICEHSDLPRRSSLFFSERQPVVSSRHMSLVGGGDWDEQNGNGQARRFEEQQIVSRGRLSSDTNPPSGRIHALRVDPDEDCEDFLLPPSPFRSPDVYDDRVGQSTGNRTCFSRQVPHHHSIKVIDEGGRVCGPTWKTRGLDGQQPTSKDRDFLDDRLRNPWQGMSMLMPMPSPDDTTPTNENQPSVFATNDEGRNDNLARKSMDALDLLELGPTRESSI